MNKLYQIFILLLLISTFARAQEYDTTDYDIKFVSADEDMWNSGINLKLPGFDKQYSFSWDESFGLGGIESVVGMDFGARLNAATKGTVGIGFYMSDISAGRIDSVIYPINIKFIIPKGEYISAGQTIKIESIVTVDDTKKPSVETTFPLEGKIGVNLKFNLKTDLNIKMCAFDACVTLDPKDIHQCVRDVMDFTFDEPILELNTFNSNPRMTIPDLGPIPCLPDLSVNIPCVGKKSLFGDYNYWPTTQTIEFFPIEFGFNRTIKSKHPWSRYAKCADTSSNPTAECVSIQSLRQSIKGDQVLANFVDGAFNLPFVDTLYTTLSDNNLRAKGADTALSLVFKPLNLIAAGKFTDGRIEVPIPCTGGNFYARYMLIRPEITLDALLKQDFNFDATVDVTLQLPSKLAYRVKNKTGTLVKEGVDSIIVYEVGNDLYIDFPCFYEFMDFNPTFKVNNKFTNRTYASLDFDGRLKALEAGMGMDEITVIPEINIHIPVPFTSGYDITIPAVTFGFDVGIGPLIDEKVSNYMSNPNDLKVEIDIFKKTWEINSFQQIKTPSFRVAPSRLIATVENDTIQCNGETEGQLTVNTSAGTAPYTYKWSNTLVGKSISNLKAGDYYVKVIDKNNCVALNGAKVFEYPQLEIVTLDTVHPKCFGYQTGKIACVAQGGNPPYSYSWSNGATTPTIENLSAGSYTLTVADKNSCSVTQDFVLRQPTELISYINQKTDVLCNGTNTGNIFLNVEGGVPGYDYQWSNGAVTQNADSLFAGVYNVTVTDKNNCITQNSATINEPAKLTAVIEVAKPISCYNGNDGKLYANISGGVEPYTLTWYNPVNTMKSRSVAQPGLSKGLYQIEVVDSNNCYVKDSMTFTAPEVKFASELFEKHLSCFESNDGEFELLVSGGMPPYSFLWSDGAVDQNRTDLPAGQYKVTITDSKNCVTYNNMVLLESFPISGTFTMKKVTCDGELDGSLEFIAKGGTPPYTYLWDSGDSLSLAQNLAQGIHSVTVTDSKNCLKEFEYDLLVDGTQCFDIPNAFSPNGDDYNDTWVIKNISAMYPQNKVQIFTKSGSTVYDSGDSGYQPWDGKYNGSDVPSGTYYYIIDLGNNTDLIKGAVTIVR